MVYDFMKSAALQAVGGIVFKAVAAVRPVAAIAREGIYEFTSVTGETYVGQSGSIPARLARHLATGKLTPEEIGSVRTTVVAGGKLVREIAEQMRIDELGGIANLANKVNPVANGAARLLRSLMMEF